MKLLAIETATENCSAALWVDEVVIERSELAPRGHGTLILGMVAELLSEAELQLGALDAVAFGRGPGAFTGVRIAAAVVQGLAFGAGLPVVPVSTLAALAQGAATAGEATRMLAALDARVGEVYWGSYCSDATQLVNAMDAERVCPPEAVPLPDGRGWIGIGSGWAAYGPRLRGRMGAAVDGVLSDRWPQAADVARLAVRAYAGGEHVHAEQALPVYLRDRVTHVTSAPVTDRDCE